MRPRTPRKLKKAVKNTVLIFDICAIPDGLDVDKMFHLLHTTGVAFYDSEKGKAPQIHNRRKMFKGKINKRIRTQKWTQY